uniref:Uncharacterized protein LOC100367135 n=1 Tax=Saccoglossus kowalevskii TaxID=10224 RepID=A0ABM0GVP0_SACKO|nr:PREDICTED: uncharacterized protein LOC100367135 [Saccoglossus kowalevskii]
MYQKQAITWPQLIRLVENDVGIGREAVLRKLPKITHEHLYLTPSLRMRVKPAAQSWDKVRVQESQHYIHTAVRTIGVLSGWRKSFWHFLIWEAECLATPNLTLTEKRKMCLSIQTLEGYRITVNSFLKLGKELLNIDGVKYFLTEKLFYLHERSRYRRREIFTFFLIFQKLIKRLL